MFESHAFLSEIIREKSNLTKIIISTIFISVGVNLIAGAIIQIFQSAQNWNLSLGIIICVISVSYLLTTLFNKRSRSVVFNGTIIIQHSTKKIIKIPRYDYGEKIHGFINSAFIENNAFQTMWEKSLDFKSILLKDLMNPNTTQKKEKPTISMDLIKNDEEEEISPKQNKAWHDFIKESTEYYVIDKLSTHLGDFFNRPHFSQDNLQTFERNDIPDVLLQNRFLELFSKPMEDRAPFQEQTTTLKHGKIISSSGKGGARYDYFDLTLPRNSTVSRIDKNKIKIDTKKFSIIISIVFDGFNTVLPDKFEKYYLGIDEFFDISALHMKINMEVHFKFGMLLSSSGNHYYRWIDSFLNQIDDDFSDEKFYQRIGWESTLTTLECMKKLYPKEKTD